MRQNDDKLLTFSLGLLCLLLRRGDCEYLDQFMVYVSCLQRYH